MSSIEALLSGMSIGLTIAAPVGPMAIVVIRRTLTCGFAAGIASGAGASTVHVGYAALAAAGLGQITTHMQEFRPALTILMAAVLVGFAIRMLRPRRTSGRAAPLTRSVAGHYASAIAFNAVNPMGFVLLLGALAAVTGMGRGRDLYALVTGVFAGSIAWWLLLVGCVSVIGIRLSPGCMRLLDKVAGMVLLTLAASALAHLC